MALHNELAVTASADHSLRVWDLSKGSHQRHLYNKNFGHKDWVTCCKFLRDGRILSGSMDSMLCLWDRRAVRCDNLSQHTGSVSAVEVDDNDVAISASYDKSLIIWDLHRLRPVSILQATAPVTNFIWSNSLLVSGERDGKVMFYDLNTGKNFNILACHTSAVHQLCFSVDGVDSNLVTSVGKDGKLVFVDLRDNNCVFSQVVHRGAINVVKSVLNNTVVTASADGTAVVWDVNMGFQPRATLKANGGIFCGEVVGNLFACGCADGNLIVFDMDTQEALFGFGVENVGGVNCIGISQNRRKLISGGDGGAPLLLNF